MTFDTVIFGSYKTNVEDFETSNPFKKSREKSYKKYINLDNLGWLSELTGGCGWNFRCMNDYYNES